MPAASFIWSARWGKLKPRSMLVMVMPALPSCLCGFRSIPVLGKNQISVEQVRESTSLPWSELLSSFLFSYEVSRCWWCIIRFLFIYYPQYNLRRERSSTLPQTDGCTLVSILIYGKLLPGTFSDSFSLTGTSTVSRFLSACYYGAIVVKASQLLR